jgi:hypothetical protein
MKKSIEKLSMMKRHDWIRNNKHKLFTFFHILKIIYTLGYSKLSINAHSVLLKPK